MPFPQSPPAPPAPPRPPSPWATVAAVLVGLWAVGVTVAMQAVGWLVEQVLAASGLDRPAWMWPVVALGDAVLVGVPAGLLAVAPRSPPVRAAGRVWLLGALVTGLLGALRAIPQPQNELFLVTLAAAAGLSALLLRRPAGGQPPGARATAAGRSDPVAILFGVTAGLALLLPWLWLGGLGGRLETLLAVAAAAALGWLAATILSPSFWSAYGSRSGARLVLLGGLVAGVALLLLAAGTGQSGTQLPTMAVLPAAGFAVAALHRLAGRRSGGGGGDPANRNRAATGWLVSLTLLGPLAFTDPEEISLLLADTRDVPFWAAVAAGTALAIALLAGVAYGVLFVRRHAPLPGRRVGAVVAAVALLAAGGVYLGPGQPGWYGEQLFVVLRKQADLSGVSSEPGPQARDARVREVYRRLVDTATRTQRDLRRDLDRRGLKYRPFYLVNAVEVDGGPVARAWLERRPDVDRVLLSQRLRPLPATAPPTTGSTAAPSRPPWNITLIGADRVWSQLGVNGAGIVVGSSDSGVDGRHPALSASFRGGGDSWYDPWNGTHTPSDNGGHGTHTLGTAVGGRNIGVAPGASWAACVNLDRNLGTPGRYLDCLQFMLAPFPPGGDPFHGRPERAPHVLTNSWGCPRIEGCDMRALRPATEALAAAGIFVVVAAGNTGPSCASVSDPPAPYAEVLTVGAVDRARRVTDFSSRGPAPGGVTKPDLVAPGADVLSALPGGGYATLDGTSMATPHVAGVVALMWSANPALIGDLERTDRILRDTTRPAQPSSASGDRAGRCGREANIVGAGLVDAYAAVQAARAAR